MAKAKFESIQVIIHPTNFNVIIVGLTSTGQIFYKIGVGGAWVELATPEV